MTPMLLRTSLRYLLRHPWQIGLCILGVALGVAVVVAIDLANASAQRAFSLSTESVTGRATHQLIGGPNGLDEGIYRQLRVDLGLQTIAPVVEGYVAALELGDQTFQLLGVDPLAEGPFRSYLNAPSGSITNAGAEIDLSQLLLEPATILIAEPLAERYQLGVGDSLSLRVDAQQVKVRIVGLLRPNDDLSREALQGIFISDIATAQEVLGSLGRISRIDLILPEDQAGAAQIAQIEAILPPDTVLQQASARSNALEQMTRAFELNLSALSLLALIVGMFLIYNTITFSVVQRRTLLGTLRCIGVTRGQMFSLVLIEASLISLIGSAVGLGLGVLLGRGLVGLVTQTINDLYFVVTVRELNIDPAVLLKGLGLGIGATLLSAMVPATEAMFTPPRTVLRRSSVEERIRRIVPFAALFGLGMLVVSYLMLQIPIANAEFGLYLAFAALSVLVLGAALLSPFVTTLGMQLLGPGLGRMFGLLGRMAARDVVVALSRTAVAVAALMVAVGVMIGVGIMVGSFRQTVVSWLDQSLVADIYVSAPSNTANSVDTTIDPALVSEISAVPGVAGTTIQRNITVNIESGPITLSAILPAEQAGQRALRFISGGDGAAWEAWRQGGIFISEPLAYRTGLGLGDSLELRTDTGPQQFPIVGVYYDYASDRGIIRMHYESYRKFWNDQQISSISLYAADPAGVPAVVEQIRAQVAGRAELIVSSNQALRTATLVVFDRTFAITAVLQLLATIVAFIGILSSLMALQLERARELGVLRANGFTPGQIWGLVLGQTSLIGLTAGLLALPLGYALALVLIHVINKRSFGWTLDLVLSPSLFGQALLVALIAALLGGIYPAFKMSQTSPALALREE